MPDNDLFEPRRDLPPMKVNAITLTVTGTVVWMAATVVVGVLSLLNRLPDRLLDVCIAGLALGLVGVAWGYVHEYRGRRRIVASNRNQRP